MSAAALILPVLVFSAIAVGLLAEIIRPKPRNSTMEPVTPPERVIEYAVRVTLPGYNPRLRPCATFEPDAVRAYDHEVSLHGKAAVEFLTRYVTRTEWVAGQLPPPVPPDPDGGLCDPIPRVRRIADVHLPSPALPAAVETVPNNLETPR